MPFLLAEILNFQGSTHRIGVGSFSQIYFNRQKDAESANYSMLIARLDVIW